MADETHKASNANMRHSEILAELDTLSSLLDDLRARMRSDRRMLRPCGSMKMRAA